MFPSTLRGLLFNVWAGFAVALLLLLAVIGLGVAQMAKLNAELEQVVAVNNVKSRLAAHMRDTLRDRAILMHDIVVSIDPWEKDDLFLRFLAFGERYAKDRARLSQLLQRTDEKRLLADLDTITNANQPIMFSVVDAAMDLNNYGALTQLQQQAIPMQNRLVDALDRMTTLQRKANEDALKKTVTAYQSTRALMLVLATAATLLAIMVAILVNRRTIKQARQLEIEKQKYQTLFETNSDAVVILGDQGFTDCNPATLKLFRMDSVETFLYTPIPQLGAPIQANGLTAFDHAMASITLARTHGHANMEWIGRRHDGSTFYAEIALHAMQLEGKPVIQAIMRDVSERRTTETAQEAARQAALQAARTKSEFVANVSHEIRTPMHGILGMSELLLKTTLDGQQREYASMLKGSAESLLTIINDILDFSKIEAGKLIIESIPFSPAALMQGVADLYRVRALEKGITLKLSLAEPCPAALSGDPTRLRQILLNLVDNAIKFTSQGEVELSARFEADSDRAICRLTVRDTGIGIPVESLTHLFEAFSQADSSTTRRFGGTGLGLTVSRQLAELMGGALEVESEPGQGSRFTLELSLPLSTLPVDEPQSAPSPLRLQGRVLVVEDHPVNQKMLAYQLGEVGLQFTLAATGSEALACYQTEPFDLVFMDWQMPEMDGLEVTRRIRQIEGDSRHTPIVALTANATHGFRETCIAAGVDDYLSKPYSESALATVLTHWLSQPEIISISPTDLPAEYPDVPQGDSDFLRAEALKDSDPLRVMKPARTESYARERSYAPLDRNALLARYRQDHVLVDELIAVFLDTTEASLNALRNGLAQGDNEACRKETHALRGAAASVLAKPLQSLAGELENCLQTPECHDAKQRLLGLEKELTRLRASLAPR